MVKVWLEPRVRAFGKVNELAEESIQDIPVQDPRNVESSQTEYPNASPPYKSTVNAVSVPVALNWPLNNWFPV